MDGLILLVILVPVIFLILLVTILNRTGAQGRLLESLYDKIKQLNSEVSNLSKELKEKKADTSPAKPLYKETPVKVVVTEKPIVKETPLPKPVQEKPIVPEPALTEKLTVPETGAISQKETVSTTKQEQPKLQPENEPDIEKFIGENLANKIGIAVLVLGIAFFVKYAIDKNWINEAGRVMIGLASGGILIGLAHYFRNSYRSFSSVLVGGGLSVFYFSIAFAFHQYHLIGQTAAFIIMLMITVFAVLLSLYYKRQELAILATIGGFITPFLVSTGQENYIALFTYLCILNAGLTALSWFKKWPAINTISLFFTTVIFSGWLIKRIAFEDVATFPFNHALLFATLFYGLFITMNIINSIRLKNKFTAFDFIILLSTNFLYYGAGIIILGYWNESLSGISLTIRQGLFTLSLGLFNLLLTGIFYRKKTVDRNFVALLTGLSLTFISLTAPVLLRGNHVVLFWAAESVVLLVLYQRSRIALLKIASLIILFLMLISLVISWNQLYFGEGVVIMPVIINKGFITTLAAAAALFIYYYRMQKETAEMFVSGYTAEAAGKNVLTIAVSLLYLAGILELYYQFSERVPDIPVYRIYLQAYSFAFVTVLFFIVKKNAGYPLLKFALTIFCLGIYLVNISSNQDVSFRLLTGNGGSNLFAVHWIADLLLWWLLFDLIRFFFTKGNEKWQDYKPAFTWIAAAGIVLLLSIELYQVDMWLNYTNETDWTWWRNLYQKAGLSICWSVCSFTMMWLGMKHHFRTLRIISLTLFTITLVKLFVYDISNIPPGGKIAAFILLGILLLVVSFMYQRLKKIIIDEKAE
jgi:uncharacterized membrane protein